MSLFSQIRTQCSMVAENARWIRINEEKIESYASSLPLTEAKNPPLDPDAHYLGKGIDSAAYFLTLESINFGSGYFPHINNPVEECSYFTISRALRNWYLKYGVIPAPELASVTPHKCAQIFGQSMSNDLVKELMTMFSTSLIQLGALVVNEYQGKYESILEAAEHSAENLVELLLQIPSFNDVAVYNGQHIPFLKRAQIAVSDISLAFANKGLGHFGDLEKLTIFADNMIPHVLRCDGLLEYHVELSEQVDQCEYIKAGSSKEIELRACSIHVVEQIRNCLVGRGINITSRELDYLLWNRGLSAEYQSRFPLHLTKTIYY